MTKNFYNGFTKLFLGILLVSGFSAFGQTTVYYDQFTTSTTESPLGITSVLAGNTLTNPVSGLSYSTATTAIEAPACKLNGNVSPTNQLIITPVGATTADQKGATTVSGVVSSFTAPYNTKLSLNGGLVSWTVNMRNSRSTGMTALENAFQTEVGSTAMATILCASDNLATTAGSSTKGWALALTGSGSPISTNKITLGHFSNGLNGVELFTPVITAPDMPFTSYFNIKVTYNPATNEWKLYVNQVGTSFVNPKTTEPTLVGTATNATNTTVTMSHFMFLYNHSGSNNAQWDNFSVTVDATIPVELVSFDAKRSNKSTLLTWKTASERENAAFYVEQSTNGTDFQTIGQVKGNGTTNTAHTYTFEHNDPSVNINYYRLKQVDFNGKSEYSPIRSVVFGKSGLVIKTTLVSDALDIVVSDETTTPLSIFNTAGQEVFTAKVQGAQRLSVSSLPAGTYIVRTAAGDVGRFVKQ